MPRSNFPAQVLSVPDPRWTGESGGLKKGMSTIGHGAPLGLFSFDPNACLTRVPGAGLLTGCGL